MCSSDLAGSGAPICGTLSVVAASSPEQPATTRSAPNIRETKDFFMRDVYRFTEGRRRADTKGGPMAMPRINTAMSA